MAGERRAFADLDSKTQAFLEHIYGAQTGDNGMSAHDIQYIRELNSSEESLLGASASINKSGSILQTLYKIKGRILPLKFNMAVNTLTTAEEALRLNYCPLENRMVAVVFSERRELPSIVFRNLEDLPADELDGNLRKIMDTELRQGFDIRYDQLMRFVVLHTGVDEYAVIVTAVQAALVAFDVQNIFRLAQGGQVKPRTDKQKIPVLTEEMAAPVMEYWSNVLRDLPPIAHLPYIQAEEKKLHARQKNYVVSIPRDIQSDLRKQAKDNKMMLMSILHTAWSFLLQQENNCQDVAYCLLVPSSRESSAAHSLVPMRMQMETSLTVQKIITKAFQQFVVSKPYAALGSKDITAIIGKREKNFDHFLNFADFFMKGKKYEEVAASSDGSIVLQNTLDVRDIKLALNFSDDDGQTGIRIIYNEGNFTDANIGKLAAHFMLVLQQLLTDWNMPYENFMQRLQKRWEQELKQAPQEDSRKVLQDCISRLALLQECEQGQIQLFMRDARLFTRFEGDRIAAREIENNLVFVVRGKVARSLETGDGWYNTLDIKSENSWINETVLLSGRKAPLSAEVLTDQALLLMVPLAAFKLILAGSPHVVNNIIQHVIRQMERYQKLWLQS